ncbi:MAG TPA: ATP-dependent 6-phosphofructokinase [Bacteroidetes bacterium]|nr:ATP-dependent 6-phosphofructokinase [Bacteroidota bacterium]HIL57360.1 ATP-dependent 6-phosphofructokinase [Rhodothermales bacterium]
MRVGVLTGGGDCPGLNAVIRAVTKSLIHRCGAEVVGFVDGFRGLIENDTQPLGWADASGLLTLGGTILGTSNKANPFQYWREDGADVSDRAAGVYREHGLDALVVIGGDGTMSIAHRLQQKGLRMVGVPKTIDNDLVGTDRTFGFDTAAMIATEAMDRLHTTAQSHHRVMICETMGRYAGWIALYAGVGAGADVVLLPEFPYHLDEVLRVCKAREAGGQRFTIISIAEGAHPEGGEMAVAKTIPGSPDPVRLGGACQVLGAALEAQLESEVRTTILGHVQRGGSPTPFDRVLSTRFGTYAAQLVADGANGVMVARRDGKMTAVPFAEVADKTKLVQADDPLVRAALDVGTSFGTPALTPDLDTMG